MTDAPRIDPELSVVICTRNRPEDVQTCLPTVLACLDGAGGEGVEVVVVDQSGGGETRAVVQALAARRPALRYLPTETVGKSRALNLGIQAARGEMLVFTDDDCEAPPDWLERVRREFAQSPDSDILFGPVLPSPSIPDLDRVCVPAWSFPDARDLRPGEVCGMGANMALRRAALGRLPSGAWYDSALGPGAAFPAAEEGDFVYRLRRAGARASLRPSLKLYHRAWRTPAHWLTVTRGYGAGDAAFWAKHARCGDGWAVSNIAERLGSYGSRALAKTALRRSPNNDRAYLAGFLAGLRRSLQMPIDRETRLYR